MFHCFNISKHISIFAFQYCFSQFLFMVCEFFAGFLGWDLALFFCPRGRGFKLSLCPGGGEFALSKNSPGVGPGGMVRLIHYLNTMRRAECSLLFFWGQIWLIRFHSDVATTLCSLVSCWNHGCWLVRITVDFRLIIFEQMEHRRWLTRSVNKRYRSNSKSHDRGYVLLA